VEGGLFLCLVWCYGESASIGRRFLCQDTFSSATLSFCATFIKQLIVLMSTEFIVMSLMKVVGLEKGAYVPAENTA
jgi:hypothetical protein